MMGFAKSILAASALLIAGGVINTTTAQEPCETCNTGAQCQNGNCQNCRKHGSLCKPYDPGHCHHTWHGIPYWMVGDWHKQEDKIPGVHRWSREDYYIRGSLPIGQRQKCYKGKIWPVDPRPTGPKPHTIHRFHAAHYWPYPYDVWSRNSVNNMIAKHEQKGWQDATTLYDYHFNADSNELTEAGLLHLKWILEKAPVRQRTLYLQTSATEGANDLRMAEVTQIASRLTAGQSVPDVMFRTTTPSGRPAQEVDAIRRGELQSLPLPRIQYTVGGGQNYGG